MKCKNIFCFFYLESMVNNCNILIPEYMIKCEAKKRFDQFVLINGIGEIETAEESSDE